jgi:hypothetical protein
MAQEMLEKHLKGWLYEAAYDVIGLWNLYNAARDQGTRSGFCSRAVGEWSASNQSRRPAAMAEPATG